MADTHTPTRGITTDELIGKRAAVVLMLVMFVFLAIGPLWIAFNGFASMAAGATPNMPEGPGVSTRDRWAGAYPYPMPAWVHIVVILALPVLLAVVWKPRRHTRSSSAGGRLILTATPAFIAVIAALCAIFAFDIGSYFPQPDGSYGLHWIAGVIGSVTAVVGGVHAHRTRAASPKAPRPRPRRPRR